MGFKVDPKINLFFREAVEDMVKNGEFSLDSSYDSLRKHNYEGDFKFIVLDRILSRDYSFSKWESFILSLHNLSSRISIPDIKAFQLDPTSTVVEQIPIIIHQSHDSRITRIPFK